jgi:hypothetical protein
MIPEGQVLQIIKEQFPEIPVNETETTLHNLLQVSNYAIWLYANEDYEAANNLMQLIGDIYNHGSPVVRMGMDNILFYNLGTWFISDKSRNMHQLLPAVVQQIIVKQFISSAI